MRHPLVRSGAALVAATALLLPTTSAVAEPAGERTPTSAQQRADKPSRPPALPRHIDGGAWPTDPAVAIPMYFVPQGISADLIATMMVRIQQRDVRAATGLSDAAAYGELAALLTYGLTKDGRHPQG